MTRFRLKSLMIFTTLVAVLFGTCKRWWPVDGIFAIVVSPLFEKDTVWAPGYTEDGFRGIRIGMTRGAVHEQLGKPLESWVLGNGELWDSWTHSPGNTHYWLRAVVFKNDVVTRKHGELYVD